VNTNDRDENVSGEAAWLKGLLDSEAESHDPDGHGIHAAMRERIDGAQRSGARRRPLTLSGRLAGVPRGIAAGAVCATLVVAVAATVRTGQPHTGSSSGAVSGASITGGTDAGRAPGSPAETGGTPNGAGGSDRTAAASPSSGGSPGHPSASGSAPASSPASGASGASGGTQLVTATGTVDPGSTAGWSQEDVAITLSEPIAGFQLSVKVSLNAKGSSTGYWTTYDKSLFDVTVDTQSNALIYKFNLRSGQTLPVGTARFAVQFNYGNPHNPANDTYYVSVYTDKAHGSIPGVSQGAF
jgi:hypothetical protein